MKRLLLLLFCGLSIFLLGGCQAAGRGKSGVDVLIEGGGEFPQSLVGTWRADKNYWEIVFGPNGTISSAVTAPGGIRMKPGQTTVVPMKLGGKGVYEPGQWMVHYIPANRELTVKISLENFRAELGEDILEGKSTDVLSGKVSEDGKVWLVDWTSFPDYVARTKKYPEFRMTEDPNYGITDSVTFRKVQIE